MRSGPSTVIRKTGAPEFMRLELLVIHQSLTLAEQRL